MSNILSLRIESWFDRRFVEAIKRAIKNNPEWAESFPQNAVLYRVPLPANSPGVKIAFNGSDVSFSFTRSLLELLRLGHRMYIVDSHPMSGFSKPVLLFLFQGLSTRPLQAYRHDWHISINNLAFPFFDLQLLRQWLVAQPAAGPEPELFGKRPPWFDAPDLLLNVAEQEPVVMANLPPLRRPFPPTSVPIPREDEPPTLSENSEDDCTGKGVRLFFGLCFTGRQLLYKPDESPYFDDVFGEKLTVLSQAFSQRGYRTHTAKAGLSGMNKCSDMIDWLSLGISLESDFCKSPCDQLVIYISAHGSPDGVSFSPNSWTLESVAWGDLLEMIAVISALTRDPRKIFLILDICHSGTVWQVPVFPKSLGGIHLITSTTGAGESSVLFQTTLLIEELKNAQVRTWEDLLRRLAWRNLTHKWSAGADDHPQWANGDLLGCAAALKLISATYEGDDLGIIVYQISSPQGKRLMKGISHGMTDTLDHQIFPLRFVGKCYEPMRVRLFAEFFFDASLNAANVIISDTVDSLCDGTDGNIVALVSSVEPAGSQKQASFKFGFRLQTKC